jgi:hypothetical protein
MIQTNPKSNYQYFKQIKRLIFLLADIITAEDDRDNSLNCTYIYIEEIIKKAEELKKLQKKKIRFQ